MPLELDGEYTTATVMIDDESLLETSAREQIQTLIDHEAFTEPVVIMPDTHWGAGAPVGFTMSLPDRIVPNVVGVDVGCGMAATNLGETLPLSDPERERRVREAVPMGRAVHEYDDAPHLVEEFPFERANRVFQRFEGTYRERFGRPIEPLSFEFSGYGEQYFKALCDRVLSRKRQGIGHVIKSAGTLGGGNHFVEFARARESGEYWLVIHSGSRYLGLAVAEYWQQRATDLRNADAIREAIDDEDYPYLTFDPETVSDADLYAWVTGGMGESHIDREAVLEDHDGEAIERTFDRLNDIEPEPGTRNTDLDYLDGREAHGYYVDMLFAQQYARWNRELMSDAICEALGVEPLDRFQSIHNYIDFRDLTIRKGATPARDGQRLVVPFNMADGSILARGKGNEAWNRTAPHGAGRTMSRREASERASVEELRERMDGVYSESLVESVLDEAPIAYKDAGRIAASIEPTAEVVDWLDPVHNVKALE
ncbi:RtcB family protein [Halapricum hydrolyticum]|uniref:tRNA-splicing ligase RtcB n=1 Tax=Halapricum hydrolyticum TaxID=2979991 RepID=A0AAE3I8R8_9EURY|nr:RtcB family protein [Halapricum hydrolyticum]MCU4716562.1 RtcB family protein [Halapricum hydrolyticum]MCU4725833.1 RtcB family protein [Halapricum hydrolyticum]